MSKVLREMTDRQRDMLFSFLLFTLGSIPWALVFACLVGWL